MAAPGPRCHHVWEINDLGFVHRFFMGRMTRNLTATNTVGLFCRKCRSLRRMTFEKAAPLVPHLIIDPRVWYEADGLMVQVSNIDEDFGPIGQPRLISLYSESSIDGYLRVSGDAA